MALQMNVALHKRQFCSGGHHDLGADDVNARDPLRHRVLNLHAGVHLDEVKLAVFEKKLKGSSATIADFFNRRNTALANTFYEFAWNARGRRFFNDFLVAALHRTVALTEPDGIFMLVGQDLDFYMPGVLQEFLHIDLRIAKGCCRLGFCRLDRVDQRSLGMDNPHATPAATARRLDDDGVTDLPGGALDDHWIIRQRTLRARHTRHARLDHGLLGRNLVAHRANGVRGRPDEFKAAFFDALCKVRVFAQKTVTRMYRLGVGHFRR